MEEYHLILQDKVLDPQCQMFYDPEGVHRDNHYGDINLVSGIPFPRLDAQAKRVRFRLLSAGVTRPWLLSLVTEGNVEVSSKICKVGPCSVRRRCIVLNCVLFYLVTTLEWW
jgi:FtsP/CotA-like multicopper oxidase with cupredoxin domain